MANNMGQGASLIGPASIEPAAASPEKNARAGITSRYPTESNELIINTTIGMTASASSAPINKYHLTQVPPVGGIPMIDKLAMKNATIVSGIVLPRPRSSETFDLWAATSMAPAQKNKVILPKACMAICNALPTNAGPVAISAPMIT